MAGRGGGARLGERGADIAPDPHALPPVGGGVGCARPRPLVGRDQPREGRRLQRRHAAHEHRLLLSPPGGDRAEDPPGRTRARRRVDLDPRPDRQAGAPAGAADADAHDDARGRAGHRRSSHPRDPAEMAGRDGRAARVHAGRLRAALRELEAESATVRPRPARFRARHDLRQAPGSPGRSRRGPRPPRRRQRRPCGRRPRGPVPDRDRQRVPPGAAPVRDLGGLRQARRLPRVLPASGERRHPPPRGLRSGRRPEDGAVHRAVHRLSRLQQPSGRARDRLRHGPRRQPRSQRDRDRCVVPPLARRERRALPLRALRQGGVALGLPEAVAGRGVVRGSDDSGCASGARRGPARPDARAPPREAAGSGAALERHACGAGRDRRRRSPARLLADRDDPTPRHRAVERPRPRARRRRGRAGQAPADADGSPPRPRHEPGDVGRPVPVHVPRARRDGRPAAARPGRARPVRRRDRRRGATRRPADLDRPLGRRVTAPPDPAAPRPTRGARLRRPLPGRGAACELGREAHPGRPGCVGRGARRIGSRLPRHEGRSAARLLPRADRGLQPPGPEGDRARSSTRPRRSVPRRAEHARSLADPAPIRLADSRRRGRGRPERAQGGAREPRVGRRGPAARGDRRLRGSRRGGAPRAGGVRGRPVRRSGGRPVRGDERAPF